MPDGLTDAMNPLASPSAGPAQQIPMAPPPDPNAPQQQSSPLSGQLQAPAQSQVPALSGGPDHSAMKHVSKLASLGHMFNTIANPTNQKPGQMFRNMLAGALM